MMITLNKKVTLIYVLSSLLLIVIFFFITNGVINHSFDNYMVENQKKRDREVVSYLQEVYGKNHILDQNSLQNLAHTAMMEDFFIILKNGAHETVWRTNVSSKGNGMMHGMMMQNQDYTGDYTSNTYPLEIDGQTIGYVEIGQYGSIILSREDVNFKESMYMGITVTALLGLIIAIVLATIMAKEFSKPILQMKTVTDILRKGHLQARIRQHSNTKEIHDLSQSINYLASSLEEQEKLRKRLTSDVSHELRTPLNVLQNNLEALMDGLWQPTEEKLKICHNEVLRLTHLVKDLEKLTNLDNVDMVLKKERCLLNTILLSVIQQFEPSFQSNHISLTYKLEDNIYAFIDKDKITQVMVNLLSNAYKFTDTRQSVHIGLQLEGTFVKIIVADTGKGIKKEDLSRIFERFYRSDPSRNRKSGGAGLGLAIVKQIVDQHSGKINVDSELGKGTIFTITLPIK